MSAPWENAVGSCACPLSASWRPDSPPGSVSLETDPSSSIQKGGARVSEPPSLWDLLEWWKEHGPPEIMLTEFWESRSSCLGPGALQLSGSIGPEGLLSTSDILDRRVCFGAWPIVNPTNKLIIFILRVGSSPSPDMAHGLISQAHLLFWSGSEDTGWGHVLRKASGRAVVLNGQLPSRGPWMGRGSESAHAASAHSLQGEDEGAVRAVAHLLLLLLTAAPQHHLPVRG